MSSVRFQLAIEQLREGVATCEREGDEATAGMLRAAALEEEGHLAWLTTQQALIEQLGDINYLTTQVGT